MSTAPLGLIYFLGVSGFPGVDKKEVSRLNALRRLGVITVPVLLLWDGEIAPATMAQVENLRIVNIPRPRLPYFLNRRYIRNYKARIAHHAGLRRLYRAIADVLAIYPKSDFVWMRYPMASRRFLNLVRAFPNQFVFEHNEKILEEIPHHPGNEDIGVQYLLTQEQRYVTRVLRYAAGNVAVTREILDYTLARSGADPRRGAVISNGIDSERIAPRVRPVDAKTLRLLMVASGADWHGVDRILKGLALYQGNWPIELLLVGDYPPAIHALVTSLALTGSVQFSGKLLGVELDKAFDYCHIAVGSLGLHRLGMTEACTLKVREYLMRGVPIILSYQDVDLREATQIREFFLQVPPTDDPVDFNRVQMFARGALADAEHVTKLRTFAEHHVTMERKAMELKMFLARLRG